jgi:Tol biopolymer transport system component
VFNLRVMGRDGSGDRQLTFGDHSHVEPDVQSTGKLLVGRTTSHSDIWKIPVDGTPLENTRGAVRITRQTGHVQVPSVSPDDREIVFVSDTGGHANLWIVRTDGSCTRPITFETDPAVAFGLPLWSPRGDLIVFVRSHQGKATLWTIRPDGSGQRQVAEGWAPCWSADGRWLYYWRLGVEPRAIERLPIDGGSPEFVREGSGISVPAVCPDGSTLFVTQPVRSNILGIFGVGIHEVVRACPSEGRSETVALVSGGRLPARHVCMTLSRDGRYLAMSLIDGATSNLWVLPAEGGPMRPVTDFGDRSIIIARSVSWSPDSRHIYAAVMEVQTDVVALDGLLDLGDS